jgi:ATP-dependent Zn protease
VLAAVHGLHYASGNNYHDAPGELNEAVKQAIDRHKKTLLDDAYATLLASLDKQINALYVAAEKVFAASRCNGVEIEPGMHSGCDAAMTGANDCPTCGCKAT